MHMETLKVESLCTRNAEQLHEGGQASHVNRKKFKTRKRTREIRVRDHHMVIRIQFLIE